MWHKISTENFASVCMRVSFRNTRAGARNLGPPLHTDEFRYCRLLYAASDINSARNGVCYGDFLALVLSPPFASPNEGVEGDGAATGEKKGSSRWRRRGICISANLTGL